MINDTVLNRWHMDGDSFQRRSYAPQRLGEMNEIQYEFITKIYELELCREYD